MGIYSQSGTLVSRPSSIDIRRQSLDRRASLDLYSDEGLKDLSRGLSLGRDSVIDPTDITAILHKKKKERQPFYSGTLASRPSSINIRRQSLDRRPSLDMLSDDGLKDLSHGLNLGRDSVIDPIDLSAILHKKKKEGQPFYRCRKRLNIWLHTHIALIVVCILSSLDAVCVIGQVICDILIMSDKLADYDKLHTKATGLLVEVIPKFFSDNSTDYLSWSFEKVVEHIETMHSGGTHLIEDHGSHDTGHVEHGGFSIFKRSNVGTPRASADDDHAEHDLLHELTHSFHIGSMVILSVLLAEAFLKIFAMGKHFLHHKLEKVV
ncbi:hypothetical protein MAR_008828 [Mya arenaria]|uniref:Uncharacterized protein n=1 Tax=Mya arenaria TaxID=6604 RepID=A0ABY7DX11_MYAAR|nr:hypothetical protein MAR_008828 [Mya arenaria]